MTITGTPASAASEGISESNRRPLISLIMEAPALSARRATSARYVSMETGTPASPAIASITGTTRRISSSSVTGSEPGRVDIPPTSMISAPSAVIWCARAMAVFLSRNCPPSENESGVTFSIPMTAVLAERSRENRPQLSFTVRPVPVPRVQGRPDREVYVFRGRPWSRVQAD